MFCGCLFASRARKRQTQGSRLEHVPSNIVLRDREIEFLWYGRVVLKAVQRASVIPARSRSQQSAVTPSARNLYFSTRSLGVFGNASLNAT